MRAIEYLDHRDNELFPTETNARSLKEELRNQAALSQSPARSLEGKNLSIH
jgi:hypothetical protein